MTGVLAFLRPKSVDDAVEPLREHGDLEATAVA